MKLLLKLISNFFERVEFFREREEAKEPWSGQMQIWAASDWK